MTDKAMTAIAAAMERAAKATNRSPFVNSYGRIKTAADAVAEADRVIAKRKARK
jgi:hypothetical protein